MKTAVIHSYNGMGDLIWHLPYIHAIAKKTKTKKIILFSKKTTNARELLDADPYIEKIIDLDDTRGIFTNLFSLFKIKNKLKENKVEKIWIFHESIKYALAGILAGVKERLGYEYGLQKFFLSKKKLCQKILKQKDLLKKLKFF